MNKLTLIVLLAVCLITAHAFVRRDAPAAPDTGSAAERVQKDFTDAAAQIQKDLANMFNPENVKKTFNEFVDTVNQTIQNLQPKPQQ